MPKMQANVRSLTKVLSKKSPNEITVNVVSDLYLNEEKNHVFQFFVMMMSSLNWNQNCFYFFHVWNYGRDMGVSRRYLFWIIHVVLELFFWRLFSLVENIEGIWSQKFGNCVEYLLWWRQIQTETGRKETVTNGKILCRMAKNSVKNWPYGWYISINLFFLFFCRRKTTLALEARISHVQFQINST